MNDDAEQTPKAPTPAPAGPSPQMFARPAGPKVEPHSAPDGTADQGATDDRSGNVVTSSRFASTGDPRVDRALAQLPDPDEHRREAAQPPARIARPDDAAAAGGGRTDGSPDQHAAGDGHDEPDDDTHGDTATGIDLPDPGLLDSHLADVTSVHRQLQQRLSDLSG